VAGSQVLRRLVANARATERSRWWTTFLLAASLSSLWLLATPLFGAPDEPAHAIRAASVARLQVVGEEVPTFEDQLVVDAPKGYGDASGSIACYAFQRDVPVDCASVPDDTAIVPLPTSAGRHPPAYYFVAGLPSLVSTDALGVYLMRVVSVLITAAFVASAVSSLERLRRPRVGALGILLAATPMMFFVGGVINPSAAEIPAALCLWAAGTVLAIEAPRRVDPRLVRRVGVAAIVLVLARQLAPLWLVLIALALLAVGGRGAVRALWLTRSARRWAAGIVAATILQGVWILAVRPLDPSLGDSESVKGLTTGSALRISFGESLNRLREMVGWFGWLDAPSPGLTYALWAVALGALIALAMVLGRRRMVFVAGAVALATLTAPIFFETLQAHRIGFFWQGRYSMPLAVGVPVLLALSAAMDGNDGDDPAHALAPRAVPLRVAWLLRGTAIAVVVAQLAAFWQALRRNTVGYSGPLDFVIDPTWKPPVPAWFLIPAYLVVVLAFVAWVGHPTGGVRAQPEPAPSGSLRYS
jgi:hypothetical protein